jgi:hypothetical protein
MPLLLLSESLAGATRRVTHTAELACQPPAAAAATAAAAAAAANYHHVGPRRHDR